MKQKLKILLLSILVAAPYAGLGYVALQNYELRQTQTALIANLNEAFAIIGTMITNNCRGV